MKSKIRISKQVFQHHTSYFKNRALFGFHFCLTKSIKQKRLPKKWQPSYFEKKINDKNQMFLRSLFLLLCLKHNFRIRYCEAIWLW